MAKGGFQNGIGAESVRKVAYKGDHGTVPVRMEAEREHFRYGLIGRPALEGNAVGGDEDAGAILAKFAVNEDFLGRRFTKESEELGELNGGRRGETADRNRNEVNAERIGARTFQISSVGSFTAQVDDGGDAEFFEFGEIGKVRLRAAKKRIRNFSGVRNSANGDFCDERGRGSRGRRGDSGRLPEWNEGRAEKKDESEEERKKAHRELARKSLGGKEEKKKEKGRGRRAQRHHKI